MNNKNTHWVVPALVAFIALFLAAYVLPPLPRPKARPQRLQTVNHLASAFIVLPSTNALPAAATNK
ncbi:MAG: hypothetical protein WCT12_35095 [Verrucomicrobiota bacterium]